MSLINDALRRAKHAQQSRAHAAAGELPLQPVEPLPGPAGVPWTLFAAVSVAALILGGGLVWQLRSNHARTPVTLESPVATSLPPPIAAPASPSVAAASAPISVPAMPPPAPAVAPQPGPTEAAASTAPAPTDAPGESTPADVPSAEPPPGPPPPTFPTLKLQGIFYSRTKPSALINGRTLFLGDQVEGAVLKRIDALEVEVEYNGQTRTLSLR
jgi:hypothetical protein